MMKTIRLIFISIVLSLMSLNASAVRTVDQEFEPSVVGASSGLWTIWDDAQTFTIGMNGFLVGFDLYLWSDADLVKHDVHWEIQTTSAGLPDGNSLISGTFNSDIAQVGQGFLHIDFAGSIPVVAGDLLALVISGQAIHPNSSLRWQAGLDSGATYSGGEAFFRREGSSVWEPLVSDRVSDFGFRTYVAVRTVDQEFEPSVVGASSGLWTIWDDAQTFTIGMNGFLVGFDLYLWSDADLVKHDVHWEIQTTSAGLPDGNSLISGTFNSDIAQVGQGFLHIDFAGSIPVVAGDLLALVISGQAIHPNSSLRWQAGLDSGATYSGGEAFFRREGSSVWEPLVSDRVSDFGFRTYVDANPVPVSAPATLLLLGTGD